MRNLSILLLWLAICFASAQDQELDQDLARPLPIPTPIPTFTPIPAPLPLPIPIPTPIPIPVDPRSCSIKEKLPGPCTFLFSPVCGVYINEFGQQVKQTFSNRCLACRSAKIQYIFPGACSNYPFNSNFCIPFEGQVLCSRIYQPVCGYFGQNVQCLVPPCAVTGSNACTVCYQTSNVVYYVPGICPIFGQ